MPRACGLIHEEILKELRRLDDIVSNRSGISGLDGDKELVPTKKK